MPSASALFIVTWQLLGLAAGTRVMVLTYNVDALFSTKKHPDAGTADLVKELAQTVAAKTVEMGEGAEPDVIAMHFQEVLSCAGFLAGLGLLKEIKAKSVEMKIDLTGHEESTHRWVNYFADSFTLFASILNTNAVYHCPVYHDFGPLGTLLCFSQKEKFVSKIVTDIRFGENADSGAGKYLGFKGALVVSVSAGAFERTPDLLFINLHLSSKSLGARRRHFQQIFQTGFDKYWATLSERQKKRGTIFFWGGDFNARTGANFQGVTDKNFDGTQNQLATSMLPCISQFIPDTKNWDTDLNRLWQEFDKRDKTQFETGVSCAEAYLALLQTDEFKVWFLRSQELLEQMATCLDKPLKENQDIPDELMGRLPRLGRFSMIFEPPISFLPSFCFSKAKKSYGCVKTQELVSLTDRVMWATRTPPEEQAYNPNYWEVTPHLYSADTVDYISDHAAVFAHFEILKTRKIGKNEKGEPVHGERDIYTPFKQSGVCESLIKENTKSDDLTREHLEKIFGKPAVAKQFI